MWIPLSVGAQDTGEVPAQELRNSFNRNNFEPVDTLQRQALKEVRRDSTLSFLDKFLKSSGLIMRIIRAFDDVDTFYVERNKYNWEAMVKATYSSEDFTLRNRDTRQTLSFRSQPGVKIGPYFGWRWLCLGYRFDANSLGEGKKYRKTEFDMSFYTSLMGIDLFYRRTGSDYRINNIRGFDPSLQAYRGHEFDGIRVNVTGARIYYVSNHKRFSYPAAFGQSTVQRRSAGSWKMGLSITQHNIRFDLAGLPGDMSLIGKGYGRQLRYMDYSVNVGYAYNWVFHRNWLLSVGATPSVGYKRTSREMWPEETEGVDGLSRTFLERGNINANVNVRVGLVWNNSRYYGGFAFVINNFNYRYHDMVMRNTFWTADLYLGLNFIRRKH